jgi:hypothetical protein
MHLSGETNHIEDMEKWLRSREPNLMSAGAAANERNVNVEDSCADRIAGETRTAFPRPAWPLLLLGSSALLVAITGAALGARSYGLSAWLGLAMLLPIGPRERLRQAGVAVALVGIAGCLFAVVLVPLGARVTRVFLPSAVVLLLRALSLRSEGVARWTDPRWRQGTTAPRVPLPAALRTALSGGRGARAAVDAAVVALSAAPLSAVPLDEKARRAFWIDVYNVLALHAGRGRASTWLPDVLEVYRTSYEVAGVRLSLDEIEHGLLRDGRRSPGPPFSRMGDDDPRRRWAVRLDPRVHFALNCGALSCPPLRFFRGEALEEELERAALDFLSAESAVDDARREIRTSGLLHHYAGDFGGERGVRAWIAKALGQDPARIAGYRLRFRRYDWTSVT